MIKVIIIEDELLTANRLKRLILKVRKDIEIIAILQTVKETQDWLLSNDEPDLYFMDIQLSDGLSFDIFSSFNIKKPVIFTTAYDEYAVKAFKANGIDYLLKPIAIEDIEKSLIRYSQYAPVPEMPNLQHLLKEISANKTRYKTNFLVELNDRLLTIPKEEVAYFYLSNKLTRLVTTDKTVHFLSSTLDHLEKEIDPHIYFRINRQFIVSRPSINQMHLYFGNRIKLVLNPQPEEDVIVSRDRVPEFKAWLDT